MERRLPSRDQPAGAVTVEAAAGIRGLAASDVEPILLPYYPAFTTNPFQALLYQQCRAHGLAPVRIQQLEQLDEIADLARAGLPVALHLHWLHLVMEEAQSQKEASRLTDGFLRRLDAHAAARGRLVWTIHNILPHEARHEREEARLCAEVAARCDAIHVLNSRTVELVSPYFALPLERTFHVPHPSYAGAYSDHVSRADARHELGIMPDELVFLVLGAIRPYKGLPELLEAWAALPPDRPRRLVIAGAATAGEPGVDGLLERAALEPSVLLDARKIPAEEMQVFLRAADIAVMPYHRPLNSGAQLLAMTFGLPVIVPANTGLAEIVDDRFGRTFAPGRPGSLADALAAASDLATDVARAAAEAAAAAVSPAVVSRNFAIGLRERLGRRSD